MFSKVKQTPAHVCESKYSYFSKLNIGIIQNEPNNRIFKSNTVRKKTTFNTNNNPPLKIFLYNKYIQ